MKASSLGIEDKKDKCRRLCNLPDADVAHVAYRLYFSPQTIQIMLKNGICNIYFNVVLKVVVDAFLIFEGGMHNFVKSK
jgi:hypothetical protein